MGWVETSVGLLLCVSYNVPRHCFSIVRFSPGVLGLPNVLIMQYTCDPEAMSQVPLQPPMSENMHFAWASAIAGNECFPMRITSVRCTAIIIPGGQHISYAPA